MICPNCGSDDIFDSELGGDASHRCNACMHWFTPDQLPPEFVTVHDEAMGVGQEVGANGMPFFINPAMFPDAHDERAEERKLSDQAAWEHVRDEVLAVPIVTGEHLPDLTVASAQCANGCHTWIGVADVANEVGYTTPHAGLPTFIAQMQGLVDFNGNVNPTVERALILALQSTLN